MVAGAVSSQGKGPRRPHPGELQRDDLGSRLNWLRAGVLGANDGIVSVAGIVTGVIGATSQLGIVMISGIAGAVAGAFSMAGGEYVSVSTQQDTEKAALATERVELDTMPDAELAELTDIYVEKGLSRSLAHEVAVELTSHDALSAHAEAELGISSHELTNPWAAAISSFVSFSVGALIPLLAVLFAPAELRLVFTIAAVVVGLFITGFVSAHLGNAPRLPAVLRNIGVGLLTMLVTWAVGLLFGVSVS